MKFLATAISCLALVACLKADDHSSSISPYASPVASSDLATLGEKGFTPLLAGDSLEGWVKRGGPEAEFAVKDGIVTGSARNMRYNSFLCSEKTYGDFIFAFQMKFDDLKGNSGCMFRAQQRPDEDGKPGRVFGYQCEHDNTKRSWTAGLFDEARRGWLFPKKQVDKNKVVPELEGLRTIFTAQGQRIFKETEWNTIVIKCQGAHVQIWLNDELRVDYKEADPNIAGKAGFFGLQVHSGKSCNVRWKNLFIKEL